MAVANVAEARPLSLPEEVIFEILTRLPARSVIRFRVVCKLWLSITHNPNFVEIQLRRARSRSRSILLFFPLDSELSQRITIVGGEAALPTQILLEPNLSEMEMVLSVSGSCNGLVCFSGHNRSIQVVNPLTMEFLIPPKPTTISDIEVQKVYFGYHPMSRDYKIIRFFGRRDQIVRGCQVYTLLRLVYRHPNKEGGSEEQLYHGYHNFVSHHFEAFVHVESLVQLRNFQQCERTPMHNNTIQSDAAEETEIQI